MLSDKEIIENLELGAERTYRNAGESMTTVDVYPLLRYQQANFKAQVEAVKNPFYPAACEVEVAQYHAVERFRQAIIKGLEQAGEEREMIKIEKSTKVIIEGEDVIHLQSVCQAAREHMHTETFQRLSDAKTRTGMGAFIDRISLES